MKMERAKRMARRESSGERRVVGATEDIASEGVVMARALPRRRAARSGTRARDRLQPEFWSRRFRSSRCSLNFEYYKGDVVILRASGVTVRPAAQFEQQHVCQMGSRFRGGREEFFQARFAELFAGGVHRLQDSVVVKENAVTCAEREFDGSIRSIWKKAEHQAVRFHFAALGVTPRRAERGKKERRVAGSRVPQNEFLQVHKNIGCGDEVLFKSPAKRVIQPAKHTGGIFRVGSLTRESHFEHGGDQRRGHAMTGDVGHQNSDAPVVHNQKIVKIPGDGAHGYITRNDFQASEAGLFARQNGRLDLVGDLQFFVDGQQALFSRERAVHGDIAQATNENQEADGLNGPVRGQQLEISKIALHSKDNEYDETCERNGDFARLSSVRTREDVVNGDKHAEEND